MDDRLKGLTIRSGVVRRPDSGYLLACDPVTEDDEPHVVIFSWQAGSLSETRANFNAHSACWINNPEEALVFLSMNGRFGVQGSTSLSGNIYNDSQPQPNTPRYGSFRSVAAVAGTAYAVGLRGMVYRLDAFPIWTRIDEGLSSSFNAQAIDGFSASDLYVVGTRGQLWQFNGRDWVKQELPTNVNLTSVKCAGDETVYVAGHDGMLLRGREDRWELIDQEEVTEDIWDLEWFDGNLYVSTFSVLCRLKGHELEPIDLARSTYHLSAAPGVLWSIGKDDVMSFDGTSWTTVV